MAAAAVPLPLPLGRSLALRPTHAVRAPTPSASVTPPPSSPASLSSSSSSYAHAHVGDGQLKRCDGAVLASENSKGKRKENKTKKSSQPANSHAELHVCSAAGRVRGQWSGDQSAGAPLESGRGRGGRASSDGVWTVTLARATARNELTSKLQARRRARRTAGLMQLCLDRSSSRTSGRAAMATGSFQSRHSSLLTAISLKSPSSFLHLQRRREMADDLSLSLQPSGALSQPAAARRRASGCGVCALPSE